MYSRRSPMENLIEGLHPTWSELYEMQVPLHFGDAVKERQQFQDLAICDLSVLYKLGVKGPGSAEWLQTQGIQVPEAVYQWLPLAGGGIVARVDRQEFFLEDGLASPRTPQLSVALGDPVPGVQRVWRQDAGVLLSGRKSTEVLAQTCGLPVEPLSSSLIMTRIAGISAALLPFQVDGVQVFRLWFPPTYGPYLWETLSEIVRELGGSPVGLAVLGA